MQKIFVHRDEMNFFLVEVQLVFYGPFQTSIVKSCHISVFFRRPSFPEPRGPSYPNKNLLREGAGIYISELLAFSTYDHQGAQTRSLC